ncbi:unnamed protein product [Linum trigynum]|uniref:DUF4283 domain-containing protein n=1 Tax=Linum trigynum TaxID=586398 RepID=A0AAV2EEN5_9ROSI
MGDPPKPVALQQWATSLWGMDGPVRVSKFGPQLMVFQFPSASTSRWVLRSGPWHFQGNPVFFRKWSPGIQPVQPESETLPIWVKIWGIPLEHHSVEGHEWIASTIGQPLWMDQSTRTGGQLGFAKVCLDLAADCGFPDKVKLYPDEDPSFEVEVEYLNKPIVCERCSIYGHDCDWLSKQGKKWVPKMKAVEVEIVDGGAGSVETVLKVQVGQSHEGSDVPSKSGPILDKGTSLPPSIGSSSVSFVEALKGPSGNPGSSSKLLQVAALVNSPESSGRLTQQSTPVGKENNPWITVESQKKKKHNPPYVPPEKRGGKGGKKR